MNHYFYDFELFHSPDSSIPPENFQGENAKKLLVVVHKSDFHQENQDFLAKVLSAIKLEMQKDATILLMPDDRNYAVNDLMNSHDYQKCLMFGIQPTDVGFAIETHLYLPFEISGKHYIVGHKLEKIKADTDRKKALWSALQQVW
ncbi:hypothetical protein [Portibacter marinus]|uniref:hypothetical protein n=1 Tax=Portibacter marinus TaxID=2898660 RepID=UPI001F428160|nr:hypothetical protein [Portibacter marinus]